jgi:hypothetical protein
MSSFIQIDTAVVKNTATEIKQINQKVYKDFNEIESSIRTLNNSWQSSASEGIINKFYEVKNNFYEPRKIEIDNFVQILNTQIGEGYETTEKANIDLSTLFK